MAAAEPLYESMDEIARLTIAIGRMNVDNVSPIFGVGKATELQQRLSKVIVLVSDGVHDGRLSILIQHVNAFKSVRYH